jgi:LysM repeat protein
VQAGVTLLNRDGSSTSSYAYDLTGHVTSVSVGGPRAHVVSFTNDAAGQVIERSVTGGPDAVTPRQYYYYYNGIQIGASGNNGNDAPDLATSMSERIAPPAANAADVGIFRNAAQTQSPFADFDQAYEPVTTSSLSAGPGTYTVRAGETLSTIAATLWGDASLWYKLAEANGLNGGGSSISAGQTLTIPNTLSNMHNTADTFRPYDANSALGDVQPGTPKPPKAKSCGIVGTILLVVVAAIVAYYVGPLVAKGVLALGLGVSTGVATGIGLAAGAAAATATTQALEVIGGYREKISWKQVALDGIEAGVSFGLSKVIPAGSTKLGKLASKVVRAALANAITQGIGTATGLKDKFDWTGVAVAGAAAAGAELAGALNISSAFLKGLVQTAAGAIAGAAARSLIEGTDFGDNILAALPSAIAATLTGLVLNEIASADAPEPVKESGGPQAGREGTPNAALNTAVKGAEANATDQGELGDIVVHADLSDPMFSLRSAMLQPATDEQIAVTRGARKAAEVDAFMMANENLPAGQQITYSGPIDMGIMMPDGARHGYINTRPTDENMRLGERDLGGNNLDFYDGKSAWVRVTRYDGSDGHGIYTFVNDQGEYGVHLGFSSNFENMGLKVDYGPRQFEYASVISIENTPSVSYTIDDRNLVQQGLDYVSDGISGLLDRDAASYEREQAADDRYYEKHPVLNFITKPFRLVDNAVYGFSSTIVRAVPGTISTISHPKQGMMSLAQGIDNVLLDTTPARVHLQNGITNLKNSSGREVAMGTGKFGANVVMIIGPAKGAGNARALSYGGAAETAIVAERIPTQLEINSAAGKAFQTRVGEYGNQTLQNFVEEVSIRPNTATGQASFKIRADGLGTNPNTLTINLLEAKGSATAPLTKNQKLGFPLLQRYGGTIVGTKGGVNYPAGTVINQGTTVQILRPSNLPKGY